MEDEHKNLECGMKYENQLTINDNIKNVHDRLNNKCELCEKQFKDETKLRIHMKC